MAVLLTDINSPEWAVSVEGFGEIAEGGADLDQCIQVIVSTAKGSDPLRPLFGSDVWRHISKPITEAAPSIIREMLESLASWETRIRVTGIEYQEGTESELQFGIKYVRAGNNNENSARITIDLSPTQRGAAPIQPEPTPIEAPSTLTAEYISFNGYLSWGFSNPLGFSFEIFRKDGASEYDQIATVANVAEYTDSTVEFDTLYTYIVRAVKGARKSAFSNEATLQTLEPFLEVASSTPEYLAVAKTGTAAIIESSGGVSKFYAPDGDPETVSAFYADDAGDADLNAGITGTLDLSALSGLRTVRARNQSFTLIPGTWVRNASVSINVSNSITTAERVTALVDSVIIANGGTTTDNGSNYTGSAGETHASRTLDIGSIELDLGDPENIILYEKIVALGVVGWTVSTVSTICLKYFDVDTLTQTHASAEIEKTRQLDGIVYGSGGVLDLSLYDTLANAQAGGATGRLAQGYALTDAWLRNNTNYNAWALGTLKAMRFYSADGVSTACESVVRYKAAPTLERSCGNIEYVLGVPLYLVGNAKIYDGTLDSEVATGWSPIERTQAWEMHIRGKFDAFNTKTICQQGSESTRCISWVLETSGSNVVLRATIQAGGSNRIVNRYTLGTVAALTGLDIAIFVSYDGSSSYTGLTAYLGTIAGGLVTLSLDSFTNTLTNSIIEPNFYVGRPAVTSPRLDGKLKQIEWLDRQMTPTERLAAFNTGSTQGAGIDLADYLISIDYDKTGATNPTTRAGTPSYTFTVSGGAEYESYL